jgi:hypothetical protein
MKKNEEHGKMYLQRGKHSKSQKMGVQWRVQWYSQYVCTCRGSEGVHLKGELGRGILWGGEANFFIPYPPTPSPNIQLTFKICPIFHPQRDIKRLEACHVSEFWSNRRC